MGEDQEVSFKSLKIKVWNSHIFSMEIISMEYMYGNPSLSKLCRKNPIRNVVGWYKMSLMVYFGFWFSRFWFERKFLMKMAKSGHFYVQLNTPSPRRRSARLGEGQFA